MGKTIVDKLEIKKILKRLLIFSSKVVLGFLLLAFVLLLVVHSPPFQKWITTKASHYLSATTKARVSIEEISFSLWGEITVEGLNLSEPGGSVLLTANKIGVTPNIISLLSGNLVISNVEVVGLKGHLINTEDGLNIQFIIDALEPSEIAPSSDNGGFAIQITEVNLENIHLNYISTTDSVELVIKLGRLDANDIELSTISNIIRLKKIYLEHARLSTLLSKNSTESESLNLFPLDFGSGFNFEVDVIEFKDNDVAFHVGEMTEVQHFDPNHLVLGKIQLYLKDLLVSNDTLSFDVQHFSTELPKFSLSQFKAKAQVTQSRLILSDLQISSGDSEVRFDILASYDSWPDLLNDLDRADIELSMFGSIDPDHLGYFLHDSVSTIFENWPSTELEINGHLSLGNAEINRLSISAGESHFMANGRIGHLLDMDSTSWQDLNINVTVGPAFRNLLSPYFGNLMLPQELQFQLLSSGSLNSFDLQSKISSAAGIIHTDAKASFERNILVVDLSIDAIGLDPGEFMDIPWLGPIDLSMHVVGNIGSKTKMEIEGQIKKMDILDQEIKDVDFQGNFDVNGVAVFMQINDPDYLSIIQSEVQFEPLISINAGLQLNDFRLGKLLGRDTTLLVSGDLKAIIMVDQPYIEASLKGKDISLKTSSVNYLMDSLALGLITSPTTSVINLYSDDMNGILEANFDIQKSPEVVENLFRNYWGLLDSIQYKPKDRRFSFDFEVKNVAPLQLFNNEIKEFSRLHISGKFDEYDQAMEVKAGIHKFNGFGISLDTLQAVFSLQHSINSNLRVENIFYDDLKIGNLDFNILTKQDSAYSNLVLSRDSVAVLGITSHFQPTQNGIYIYLDSLISFDEEYNIDRNNPVFLGDNNLLFEHFIVSKNDFEMVVDGDLSRFDLSINNADLRNLNYLIASDSAVIHSGTLNGMVSYYKAIKRINIQAEIDSLSYKKIPPINISAKAITEGTRVPIEFSLRSATNNIELAGDYFVNNSEIDALLEVDINNLEMFQFLFSGIIDEISGRVHGKTRITGTLQEPNYQGTLKFQDVNLTTTKPKSTFQLRDEIITLDNSGITLYDFTIYDQRENPLTLNGALITKDYQSFEYDLTLDTDDYLLVNNPATEEYPVQGILVVGSNLKLRGNEKDTYVEARIIIKDTTELTYVTPQENLELLTSDGIVEFIDPEHATDSIRIAQNQSFYDSLISTLPNFDLTSAITLEDQAVFRVIVDARSGDYIEASGAADLKLSFDRTGNIQLTGNYTITKGFYQLSFYNIVKKKFTIAPGSTVNWTGNPNNGDLHIIALHTITTSSIGLIGHEIGESEKALYQKALPYEVGIVITGSIESPQISFSLDLPEEEKVKYPALASKLDRFKQPEFESELNTQVFGLLVLGGFIPESSSSDFDQSLIAATTLSNSVNSILASQFNRFASQIIKGVDINVGLQTYADFTGGVGHTRTAMDFRVSKRLMDDRLSIQVGGGVDINSDQSGVNIGGDSFRGDITVIYDLTESGSKQLKVFNNETYDIIYHEIRNTGISLIFIREFDKEDKKIK